MSQDYFEKHPSTFFWDMSKHSLFWQLHLEAVSPSYCWAWGGSGNDGAGPEAPGAPRLGLPHEWAFHAWARRAPRQGGAGAGGHYPSVNAVILEIFILVHFSGLLRNVS